MASHAAARALLALLTLLAPCAWRARAETVGFESPTPTPSPSATIFPSPTPLPSNVPRCSGERIYTVVATYRWRPRYVPPPEGPDLGFTPLLCAAHTHRYKLWSNRRLLSPAMVAVLMSNNFELIRAQLDEAMTNGTVVSYRVGEYNGLGNVAISPGTYSVNVTVDGTRNATLLSCFAAFVPSPDWFVGFDSVDVCNFTRATGNYSYLSPERLFNIFPLDGGLDQQFHAIGESIPEVPQKVVLPKQDMEIYLGNLRITDPFAARPPDKKPRGGVCFPAHAVVRTARGALRMHQLRVGDRVLARDGAYTPVFMFTHRLRHVRAPFVTVRLHNNATLSASASHYVYVEHELRAMDSVRVGERMHDAHGRELRVVGARTEQLVGLYNPHTLSGELEVNGVLVSTFTRAVSPPAAASALSPMRTLHVCGARALVRLLHGWVLGPRPERRLGWLRALFAVPKR